MTAVTTGSKKAKPQNSNEMLAYLSNREYKSSDLDDFSNFNIKAPFNSDYKEKFNDFFPEHNKKENNDSFFVKSITSLFIFKIDNGNSNKSRNELGRFKLEDIRTLSKHLMFLTEEKAKSLGEE